MSIYESLDKVPHTTRERLAYIDFALMFKGETNRVELCRRFNVYPTQVTKDFVLYKEFAPTNLTYDPKLRMQVRSETFTPLFEYHASKVLSSLSHGFGDGIDHIVDSNVPIETPYIFNEPNLAIVAKITEALYRNCPIEISYVSLSNGERQRTVIPHTIVNNGLRWHMRAYDKLSESFRDFVLTRIKTCSLLLEIQIQPSELKTADEDWNEMIELVIVPHPRIEFKEAIELDYGMVDGCRKLLVRKANVDYLLRLWNVDATSSGRLIAPEFHLWLKNAKQIKKTVSLVLAPIG